MPAGPASDELILRSCVLEVICLINARGGACSKVSLGVKRGVRIAINYSTVGDFPPARIVDLKGRVPLIAPVIFRQID